jgi:hypothetical protein
MAATMDFLVGSRRTVACSLMTASEHLHRRCGRSRHCGSSSGYFFSAELLYPGGAAGGEERIAAARRSPGGACSSLRFLHARSGRRRSSCVVDTPSTPMRRSAATMRPMAFSTVVACPAPCRCRRGRPARSAPTTLFSPGRRASCHTSRTCHCLTTMAPVGQTAAHWPQPTHGVGADRVRPKAVLIVHACEPRKRKVDGADVLHLVAQTRTQSPHRMHLLRDRGRWISELASISVLRRIIRCSGTGFRR